MSQIPYILAAIDVHLRGKNKSSIYIIYMYMYYTINYYLSQLTDEADDASERIKCCTST